MTELAHGSNVRDLETEAIYDPITEEFIIRTPSESARKEWIGNAARHGRTATVFAQLETRANRYGVHAFVVPIRNKDGSPYPGVRIQDCGHKLGLNGVDNGRLWFDDVRVPREALLDRFASVAADGTYHSPIVSDSKRFFTTLGTLVGGRVSVGAAGVSASKSALTIAIRYSDRRRQFGPEDATEVPILDYPTPPGPPLPPARPHLRAPLRIPGPCRRVHRKPPHRGLPPNRSTRRRSQGDGHVARHRHNTDLSRGVRWSGVCDGQPVRGSEGRHRHLRDLRRGQYGPHAARGEGSAHGLPGAVPGQQARRPRPVPSYAGRRRR